MAIAIALAAGFVVGSIVLIAGAGILSSPILARPNHRGAEVPTAGGVVPVIALMALAALDAPRRPAEGVALVAVTGFCLLGVIDDVAGGADAKGFRGHLAALVRGRLTTGGLKLLGGTAVAVVVARAWSGGTPERVLVDAALIALAANLGNLFDRAPGRVVKVGVVSFLLLAVATAAADVLVPIASVVGAFVAVLIPDLRERLMLGDAGANVLGAALGLGVVVACSPATRLAVLGVVLALNALAEFVSFSRLIAAVGPLRFADRLGRLP